MIIYNQSRNIQGFRQAELDYTIEHSNEQEENSYFYTTDEPFNYAGIILENCYKKKKETRAQATEQIKELGVK